MVEETELEGKGEQLATDRDLCALEAWALSSSHELPGIQSDSETNPQVQLEELFRNDRNIVLTPNNVLKKVKTVEEENKVRSKKPFSKGVLSLFGPAFMFNGYRHELLLDELSPEGTISKMTVRLTDKTGQQVDPSNLGLSLDPSFEPFFEGVDVKDSFVVLKVKK